MRLVIAAAVLAWGPAALAQTGASPPRDDEVIVARPGARIVSPLPSGEAMKLGRRIAYALHQEDLSKGVHTLIALVKEEEQTPSKPGEPLRPAPFTAPEFSDWADALYDRAVEHVAFAYARRYSEAELSQMTGFFESPTGKKFLWDKSRLSEEIEVAFRSRAFERDFIALVCRPPTGPVDAALKRPGWCDDPAGADPHVGRPIAQAVERFGRPMEVTDYHGQGRFFTFSRRAHQIVMDRDAADERNWTSPRTRQEASPPDEEDYRTLPSLSYSPPQAPPSCTLTLVADWDEARKAWIAKRAIRGEAEGGERCMVNIVEG